MSEQNGLATAGEARAIGGRVIRRYKLADPLPVNGLQSEGGKLLSVLFIGGGYRGRVT